MPRPTTPSPCAKCAKHMAPGWESCEHLQNTYDKYVLKTRGRINDLDTEEALKVDQELVIYALNRMLALDRDNGNKAQGMPASRRYKSRNETTARALANLCGHPGPRGFKCIRQPHPNEPDRHRF